MRVCSKCLEHFEDEHDNCPTDGKPLLDLVTNDPRVGETIVDRFLLLELLGKGGMGAVYRAYQLSMQREVAMKVLLSAVADDDSSVQRFIREARSAAQLRSPHTVVLYDFGETAGGELFIAMELLSGKSLEELLTHTGQIPVPMALDIVGQVCLSLEEAHSKGIIHRDLKPANIMLETGPDGRPMAKVVDFGIAKVLDLTATALTQEGLICGTPAYMAPEQALGKEIGPHTDIYSLGIVLYEMLSGRRPFEHASAAALLVMQATDPAPSLLSTCPDMDFLSEAESVVACCLKKEPAERFVSAAELRAACERLAASLTPGKPAERPRTVAKVTPTGAAGRNLGGRGPEPDDGFGTDQTLLAAETELLPGGTEAFEQQPEGPSPSRVEDADTVPATPVRGRKMGGLRATAIVVGVLVLAAVALLVLDPFGRAGSGAGDQVPAQASAGQAADSTPAPTPPPAPAPMPESEDMTPDMASEPAEEPEQPKEPDAPKDVVEPAAAEVEEKKASGPGSDGSGEEEAPRKEEKKKKKKEKKKSEPDKSPAPARISSVKVSGPMDLSAARKALGGATAKLRGCHARTYEGSSPPPPVRVNLMVNQAGQVLSVRVKPKDAAGSAFAACAKPALKGLSFPSFDEGQFAVVSFTVGP